MKKLITYFLDMRKADYQSKTLFFSAFSALVGIGFTLFNAALGILYKSVWNGTICVYYVLLAIVRGIIVYSQRRPKTAGRVEDNETNRKVYIRTHTIMIFMDICLIVPIAYMVIGKRSYEYGMIPAIAMATYTTYRVTMSVVNFIKSRKQENILIKALRTVNLQDSLVSVLTLQNALIIATGSGMKSMMVLTGWTSAGIWLAIIIFTVKSFLDVRIKK
jgi:hypothetical protein